MSQESSSKPDIVPKEEKRSPFSTYKKAALIFLFSVVLYYFYPTRTNTTNNDYTMPSLFKLRSIANHFIPREVAEGVGARVKRSVGSMQQRRFTPFLMLDDFTVKSPSGFPDHPHHGQETITYVIDGLIAHEDFTGSKGVLRPGDLQFMTAGKGIVHSEMPVEMEDGRPARGLQLWVDLPKDLKNCEPRYRNLRSEDIPVVKPHENLEVRVISGKSYGTESVKDLAYTPIDFYYMLASKAGTEFAQEIPSDFNAFLYVMKGSVVINEKVFKQNTAIFFDTDGEGVAGQAGSDDTEFAIIGGKILDQPLVQHGPFVETDQEKLYEAFMNYEGYTKGFERAKGWRSDIASGINESEAKQLLE
ncbi:pirin family protein KNAG_0D02240 [Huiozyma naganishii CBS 8797]|uniref:Pirin N-terminal domain-containing protein n=1 Tax=Huiozyma naganishii (strain ATCC MYA-139 / BCRC 22969 / CBS 8797 / KCTC 17520 / NBRC 10181 / NCYC 3082 / Yp74L-3) TaxID=1071383 RepID=J7S5S2_HUIN7|nr:hypothetical protein KNAG_0D02240 [Kazachstania naganishii CBS 8797]CCK69974.1 hypothetical protein KNAG_0D02240 [Kazachstania naganishii CBS 8797]